MVCHGVLFYGWMTIFAIFQSRSIACEWTCTWSWSWEYDKSLTRVKVFDKTQSKVKLHLKVWAWTSNFGFGRISLIWGDKLLMILWKEIPSTLHGRAWFHSSNHITLVNYLDSMGSLWRYICSQELVRMRGIKSMQVYSWKRMECTWRIGMIHWV